MADERPMTRAEALREAARHVDNDKALQLADKAVADDPKSPNPYELRAEVRDLRHEYDKAIEDYTKVLALTPDSAATYQRRGEDQFRLGHFKESVADFDKVIALDPRRGPYHWQRGISLYYAGEFEKGAKQFESHKTVNPNDVENAVWHFLCVARLSGVEKARSALIPIAGDGRVPMMQVYALFAGKGTADDVMNAVKAGEPKGEELSDRMFYAHLYLGLYDEACGRAESEKEHLKLAAEKYAGDDYMGDVARVHVARMKAATQPAQAK
jgi:lipoprotein NlpI